MELERTITNLIALCRENATAYERAATALVALPEMAHFFDEQAENRRLLAYGLERRLTDAGKRLVAEILEAPPKEGWTEPAAADRTPREIIETLHRAEERAVDAYERALSEVPEQWRWEIREQEQSMRSALAKFHAWMNGKDGGAEGAAVRGSERDPEGDPPEIRRIRSGT